MGGGTDKHRGDDGEASKAEEVTMNSEAPEAGEGTTIGEESRGFLVG